MRLLEHTLGNQRTLDFLVAEEVVAVDDDVAHLHLRLLVNVNIQDDHVLVGHVVTLGDGDDGILVALAVKILLCQDLGTVNDIRMKTHALHHA